MRMLGRCVWIFIFIFLISGSRFLSLFLLIGGRGSAALSRFSGYRDEYQSPDDVTDDED